MAVVAPVIEENTTRGDFGHVVTWGPIAAGDSGGPLSMIGSSRRTVQVIGALAGGSKLAIEGSNDGLNWALIRDLHGNALIFNAPGIATVGDLTLWIRPRATVGNPAATVIMLMRKTEMR